MPLGLYIKSSGNEIDRGDIVAICFTEKARTYFGMENCKEHPRLLKQVMAIPGDHVELSSTFIKINNEIHPFIAFSFDKIGNKLEVPIGRYANTEGFWLFGVHPRSWDSRYFGSLARDKILYKMTPIFTW